MVAEGWEKEAALFWAKVERGPTCWMWTGRRNPAGYGVVKARQVVMLAHRFAMTLTGRPVPAGLCVMHRCDNPGCVRPSHLRIGTREENRLDCVNKGRQAKGVNNGRAKLKPEDVPVILRMVAEVGPTKTARHFGVDRRALWAIRNGKTWRTVPRDGAVSP